MRVERVPKHRRNPEPRPFALLNYLVDGRVVLFIGWWKVTLKN